MKNEGKFSFGMYLFAMVGGMVSGLLFSKAAYHKGQADAYNDIAEDLEKITNSIQDSVKKEEES